MPILHAVILGITQGLSEFLPISSSGHLLLVPWLFGWHDFVVAGTHSDSLEKTFDVALHIGTLIGAIAYFRADIVTLAKAALWRAPAEVTKGTLAADHPSPADDRRLAWLLVVASIPGALVGAALESTIEERLGQFWLIGIMLVVFGLVLLWADRLGGTRAVPDFRLRDALLMGSGQALALSPGVSRSGITITVSRRLGFDRDAAARLSFLMALPITGGAVLYKGAKLLGDGFPSGFEWPFVWGIVASAVTGYAAVWAVLRIIRTRSFTPFVVYRVVAGLAVVAIYGAGIR
ncbi:MAG: undecaprenyl-diphosphate phosphatase [Acidimicrobiales bacterium]